jgi:hypothetical protein
MVASVIVLATCFSSDLTQERPKHIMAVAGMSAVSLAIVAGVQGSPRVRLHSCASVSPITYSGADFRRIGYLGMQPYDTELSVQYHLPTRREKGSQYWNRKVGTVTRISVEPKLTRISGLANLSSVYGSYIWPSSSAPEYIPGFVTTTMLQVGSFLFALSAWYLLKKYPYPAKKLSVRLENVRERA